MAWAWFDSGISEDEAYMQLATSNEQDAMSGIERAVHVRRYCEKEKGGRSNEAGERTITKYSERARTSKSSVSMLWDAGDFEINTQTVQPAEQFVPTVKLWYELSQAPRETWQTLREAAETRGWTVAGCATIRQPRA